MLKAHEMPSLCLPSACLEKAVTSRWPEEEKLELSGPSGTDGCGRQRALVSKRCEFETLVLFLQQILRGLNEDVKLWGYDILRVSLPVPQPSPSISKPYIAILNISHPDLRTTT